MNRNDLILSGLTKERIQYLDSFRAVAIMMVIGVHALSYCLPLSNDAKSIIVFIVHTISVPIFFLVDGFLFARNNAQKKEFFYLKTIQQSAKRLLLPWLIFSLIYMIARYFFELFGVLDHSIINKSFQELIIALYASIYAPQLYFLPSLFFIRLLGPLIRRVIFNNHYLHIFISFIFIFTIYQLSASQLTKYLQITGGQEPILHAVWGLQFYLTGILLHRTLAYITAKKLLLWIIPLFFGCLLIIDNTSISQAVSTQYLYLIGLFLLFASTEKSMPMLNLIGQNTMGIYLLHSPIIIKAISLALNKAVHHPLLNYVSLLFISLLISLALSLRIKNIPYGYLLLGEQQRIK